MMMLTHAAVSGGIGEAVGNPFIAFALGVVAHLALDKVPHTYIAEIFGKKGILRYTDTILTLIFFVFLALLPSIHRAGLIWGALGGIAVDAYLIGIRGEKGFLAKWHTERQPHKKNNWYVLTDVVLFLLGVAIIFWWRA